MFVLFGEEISNLMLMGVVGSLCLWLFSVLWGYYVVPARSLLRIRSWLESPDAGAMAKRIGQASWVEMKPTIEGKLENIRNIFRGDTGQTMKQVKNLLGGTDGAASILLAEQAGITIEDEMKKMVFDELEAVDIAAWEQPDTVKRVANGLRNKAMQAIIMSKASESGKGRISAGRGLSRNR